ncbi:MAG TPA: ribonuclease P protein component [Micromonosporaceae bacterium]
MLAATDRLRRRDEFSATVAGGRRAARGSVVVHLASRPSKAVGPTDAEASGGGRTPQTAISTSNPARISMKPSVRVGFVVSKAVGGAVVRNRVRRRLRHLMRARLDRLPDRTDVVVRALPGAANRTYAALGADLDGALSTIVKDPIRPARPGRRGRS